MRLTPAQLAVHFICGQAPGRFDEAYPTLCERLSAGRAALVRITGKVMKEALASESWRAAAAGLT